MLESYLQAARGVDEQAGYQVCHEILIFKPVVTLLGKAASTPARTINFSISSKTVAGLVFKTATLPFPGKLLISYSFTGSIVIERLRPVQYLDLQKPDNLLICAVSCDRSADLACQPESPFRSIADVIFHAHQVGNIL